MFLKILLPLHVQMKYELQNILQGKSAVSYGEPIQTILRYFGTSQKTGGLATGTKQDKAEETARLKEYIQAHHLWMENLDLSNYLSEGAEQRVYIKDAQKVFKLNDAVYYATWVDYFCNLLLNNYFFPDTAYHLLGFYLSEEKVLYALVAQNYVKADQATNLDEVKLFLENNGFQNTKNHDYYNPDLGIILEDLHDENVLTCQGLLYFIDTVFYINPSVFWL